MKIVHILHHSMSLVADQIGDKDIFKCTAGFPVRFAREIKKKYPGVLQEYWRPERKLREAFSWKDPDGILHRVFPSLCLRFNWEYSPSLISTVRSLPENDQTLIFLHGLYNLHSFFFAPLLKTKRAIVQSHGGLPGRSMVSLSDNPYLKFFYPALQPIEKRLYPKYPHIFAISSYEQNLLFNDLRLHNVSLSPVGVDFDHFSPGDKKTARKTLRLSDDEKIILFVGRLAKGKGINYLIDAYQLVFKKFSKARMYIIGQGPLQTELENQVGAMGFQKKVVFVGYIEHNALPVWYRAADLSVMPSPFEWFGLVAAESMACGTPCVAVNAGGAVDIINEFDCGDLVPPRDSRLLAQAIINHFSNLEKSYPNIHRARRKFGWDQKLDHAFNMFNSMDI